MSGHDFAQMTIDVKLRVAILCGGEVNKEMKKRFGPALVEAGKGAIELMGDMDIHEGT